MAHWRRGELEEEEVLARTGDDLEEERSGVSGGVSGGMSGGMSGVATTKQLLLSPDERSLNRSNGTFASEETSLNNPSNGVSFFSMVWNKLSNAHHSIATAVRQNSGSMAAIFVSCFLEFAAPGLIPYQVPEGPDHAANSFWVTVFYLSGSLIGRLLTAVVSFKRFTLLNVLQGGTLVYMLVVARMTTISIPLPISIVVIAAGSAIHGYIVTEVFQTCREAMDSARSSAVAGLANQVGALMGSVFVFVLVSCSLIGRT
jgi:hypothetical protein